MNKRYVVILIASFILSIALYFNAKSSSKFLKWSALFGLILFGLFVLASKFFESVRDRRLKQSIVFIIAITIYVIFTLFAYETSKELYVLTMITPPHFRTNILTGSCSYGGVYPTLQPDPWYYKQGCDLPTERLVQIVKESNFYKDELDLCDRMCQFRQTEIFCSDKDETYFKIRCDLIMNCEAITCESP